MLIIFLFAANVRRIIDLWGDLSVCYQLFMHKHIYIINGISNSVIDERIIFLLIKQFKDSFFFYFSVYSSQMSDTRNC